MTTRRLPLALGALALVCAGKTYAHELSALAFLSGHWREASDQGSTEETWLGPRGDLMVAANLNYRNGRAGFEYLRIVKRDGAIVYIASPEGRAPTDFPLKELRDDQVVFENPEVAFPRRIVYHRRDGATLVARIEGTLNGQPRAREWIFKRVTP